MRDSRAEAAFLHIIDTSRLLDVLKGDPRAIVTAASKAQAAADWMHARQPRPVETPADPAVPEEIKTEPASCAAAQR